MNTVAPLASLEVQPPAGKGRSIVVGDNSGLRPRSSRDIALVDTARPLTTDEKDELLMLVTDQFTGGAAIPMGETAAARALRKTGETAKAARLRELCGAVPPSRSESCLY